MNINIFPTTQPARYSSLTETDSIDAMKAELERARKNVESATKNIPPYVNEKLKWQHEATKCVWSGGLAGILGACGGHWKCDGKCTNHGRNYFTDKIARAQDGIDYNEGIVKVNNRMIEEIQAKITLLTAATSQEEFINKPTEEKIAESDAAMDAKTKNLLTVTGIVVAAILCISGAYVMFKKAKVA